MMKYTRGWSVELGKAGEGESQHFFLGEGRCEGRITGHFQATNHPSGAQIALSYWMYKA
jgi:hypothetical protein